LKAKPDYLKLSRNLSQAKVYGYPDAAAIQQHTLEYYSVITEMDGYLGLLFHELEDLGIKDNTYIFFMSDNGWMLGEHGFTSKVLPYKASASVPFFVAGPEINTSVNDKLVLNIDMAPTLLELAGIDVPKNIHGKSIVPLMHGKEIKWRQEYIYEGLGTYGNAKPNLTVVNSHYRYIETYSDEQLNTIIFRELYNQNNDKEEMVNIVNNSEMSDLITSFQQKIFNHKQEIIKK
jgi:N-acetylglucosamine-6-sulfatase